MYSIVGDFCIAFPCSVFSVSVVSCVFLWDLFLFLWFVCTFVRDCVGHVGLVTTGANYMVQCPLEQFCVAKLVYPCFETYQVRKSPCQQSHLPWPGTAGIAHGGRMRSTQDSCDGCVEAASCLVRPRVHGPPVAPYVSGFTWELTSGRMCV